MCADERERKGGFTIDQFFLAQDPMTMSSTAIKLIIILSPDVDRIIKCSPQRDHDSGQKGRKHVLLIILILRSLKSINSPVSP